MSYRKKLIEVALPLEAINKASAREKSIRHGHPSTMHLWWSRKPLATCRAVLFASLVDDPSSLPEQFPTDEDQERERQRLFRIIEELVLWESSNDEAVLAKARTEIVRSTNRNPPPVLDPFAGGGSIPLEAQRLGLEAHASDLNPVAVLINKALIEIPPKFAGQPPINSDARNDFAHGDWHGAQGLAEDVRYYGQWMRDEAERRIGHLYPKVQTPKEYGGGDATVIAWLYCRSVRCPNPACGAQMPLTSKWWLSTKKGREIWVEPVIDRVDKSVRFTINNGIGAPPPSPKTGRGAKFQCIVCSQTATDQHIKDEGVARRMGIQLMAIVAEGVHGRIYLPPSEEQERISALAQPRWTPTQPLADDPRNLWCVNYGLDTFEKLFTARQLVALTTFSELVSEARAMVLSDATILGHDAPVYADAVATYLALAIDKGANLWSSICSWMSDRGALRETFARQALPMSWDFVEANPFSESGGNISMFLERITDAIRAVPATKMGIAQQLDATGALNTVKQPIISTDPPYYDNIGYADLSDFFYVWLRKSIGHVYPQLFNTLLVPKVLELVATPYRFGGSKNKARTFFEDGLGHSFAQMRKVQHPDYPLTIYYAFKQSETDDSGVGPDTDTLINASTGWETMLEGLLRADFEITGTWPVRTESSGRAVAQGTNALASSIVLVCRPRSENALVSTRREFLTALKRELPTALRNLQHGNIAPVDLAQASIGPGMAVFSRYSKVVESDGTPMRVRTALQIINQALDEVLAEQEGEYDADTRWAIAWFDQYGTTEGPYGIAETLSKAKNTSVSGLAEGGILTSKSGKVQLLRRDQLSEEWNPTNDARKSVWEVTQHLIRALDEAGDYGAATILKQVGSMGEAARDLAYRLYTTCERKGWAQDALAYNSLVVAWPGIVASMVALPGIVGQSRFDV